MEESREILEQESGGIGIMFLEINLTATDRRGEPREGVALISQRTHMVEAEGTVKSGQGGTEAFRRIW